MLDKSKSTTQEEAKLFNLHSRAPWVLTEPSVNMYYSQTLLIWTLRGP